MYSYQHKYISQSPPVNNLEPWSINKTVKMLMGEVLDKYTDHPKPFLYLSNSEPYCFAPWVDVTRSPLGFDREAIPNLKKTLLRTKSDVHVAQALCSLNDLVRDPEKACEALRLNILQALVRLMHHRNMFIRIKTLDVLEALATAPFGRSTIAKDAYIMAYLKRNMIDPEEVVRLQSFRTLRALAAGWFALDSLIEEHFVQDILSALKTAMESKSKRAAEHLYYLLDTLEYILEYNDDVKKESIRYDIFNLKPLVKHPNPKVRAAALGVFTQLGKHKLGREGFLAHGVMKSFTEDMFTDEDDQMQAKLLSPMMFSTALIQGKKDAIDKNVHKSALDVLTNEGSTINVKRNAAKVLTNLAKMPEVNTELVESLPHLVNVKGDKDAVLENQLTELIDMLTDE